MNTKLAYRCPHFEQLSTKDLYEIMALRQRVFVVEQNCPYLDADGIDFYCHHLMGFKEMNLVAYARLVPGGIAYPEYVSIGRVITAPEVRRVGLGREMMERAILETRALFGTASIKISAQCYLLSFYESFGFRSTGAEYLEDGIPHIAMILS